MKKKKKKKRGEGRWILREGEKKNYIKIYLRTDRP